MHFKKLFSTKRRRVGIVITGVFIALTAIFFFAPLHTALTHPTDTSPTRLLDRNGKLLFEVRAPDIGSSAYLPFAKIPPVIVDALIATEDRAFFSHAGVSVTGITRAAIDNAHAGRVVSGGSTITQQLVRARLHPAHRDLTYKLKEAYFALRLEMRMTKADILESYLNAAYFGHQAYGLRAAAETYFEVTPSELSTAQAALIVGLVQSPTTMDPFVHLERAVARQHRVLDAMVEAAKLSSDERDAAEREPIHLAIDRTPIRAPHFVMWMRDTRGELFENEKEIRTTLDLDLESETERIITNELAKLKDKNVTSAAVVVLDAETGDVLAMIGSADYFDATHDGTVNVATSSRQPGSALKPFTYALALTRGDTPATTVTDIAATFPTADGNPYTPRNYDYRYHGLVRYREALANSYNIAAVKVLEKIGVDTLLHFLASAGITTLDRAPSHYGLALTLGSGEVRLLELARAYGVFARGGVTLPLRTIVTDPTCDATQHASETCGEKILDEKIAWQIADILADNDARLPEFGADSPLAFTFPVAAKTGTTRNSRDNWTIGFTQKRIVGVWVGNANNDPMRGTSGVSGAGPIFHAVMTAAMRGVDRTWIARPDGIIARDICRTSGKLPTPDCPRVMTEYFISGTEPHEHDDIYRRIAIDTRNGLRAGDDCPAHFVEKKIFTVVDSELQPWARDAGWSLPPATYSPLCPTRSETNGTSAAASLRIVSPTDGDTYELDPMIPDDAELITLEAATNESIATLAWYIDGEMIGDGAAPRYLRTWHPTVGRHTIEIRSGTEKSHVMIEVVR